MQIAVDFVIRPDWESKPGGDSLQLKETVQALQQRGVTCRVIASSPPGEPSNADVLHVFNVERANESLQLLSGLQSGRRRLPLVLSSIYQPKEQILDGLARSPSLRDRAIAALARKDRYDLLESAKASYRLLRSRTWPGPDFWQLEQASRKKLVERCSAVVVLGDRERDLLRANYDILSNKRVVTVPNGIPRLSLPPTSARGDGAVCVGRVEPRKNQLFAAKVALTAGVRLDFIGLPNPNYPGYSAALKQLVQRNPGRLSWCALSHAETLARIAGARVCLSTSWSEVLPLVDFEAVQMGAALLTTSRSCSSEHLPEMPPSVRYLDPLSDPLETWAAALRAACPAEPVAGNLALRQWSDVADALHLLYLELVDGFRMEAEASADTTS